MTKLLIKVPSPLDFDSGGPVLEFLANWTKFHSFSLIKKLYPDNSNYGFEIY